MSKDNDKTPARARAPEPTRRARLHAQLFAGAAFGTTLLAFVGTLLPKLPPSAGE